MRRALRAALKVLGAVVAVCVLLLVSARVLAGYRERAPRLVFRNARIIRAGDVRVFLQLNGPPDDSTIVLIHGTGAWSEIWRPVMDSLGAHERSVVALDMPPFGFSDRSPTADYTPATQAARIWAVLDSLVIRRPTLVGHSFGARATVAAALDRPERVARLVLIDAALGIDTTIKASQPPALARAILAVPALRDAIVAATLTNPRMTRRITGALVAHPERLTDAQIEMLRKPLYQRGATAALGAWLPGFLADAPDVHALRRSLAAFRVPTHVIWGQLDSLTPVASGRDIAGLLPCATWDVLSGSGHIPGLEAPDALSRVLVARLQSAARCRDSTRTSRASR